MLDLGLSLNSLAVRRGGFAPVAFADFLTTPSMPAFLTHSRAGGAMVTDSTGKLTWAPENLVTYSEDFTNAAWSKLGNGTGVTPVVTGGFVGPQVGMSACRVQLDIGSGALSTDYSLIRIFNTHASLGVNFLNSVWLKSNDSNSYIVRFYAPEIAASVEITVTPVWQRFSLKSLATTTNKFIGVFLIGNAIGVSKTADILMSGAQQERVTYETAPRTYKPTTSAAYYGPRFDHDVAGNPLGYLNEQGVSCISLWNRDFTNEVWVKPNITAAKDQIGIDGVANSASRITATSSNATVLQSATYINNAFCVYAWVKRLVGSGVVEMTVDNGTTWTAIAVTAGWTRVAIPRQVLSNPTFGIRIVTNGDSIAVDFFQTIHSLSTFFATSPIWTTTAAVTRASDLVTGVFASMGFNPAEATLIVEADPLNASQMGAIASFNQAAAAYHPWSFALWQSNNLISLAGNLLTGFNKDATTETAKNSGVTVSVGVVFRTGIRQKQSDGATGFAMSVNGGNILTGQVRSLSGTDAFGLCQRGATLWFTGHVRSLALWPVALNDNAFRAKTTVGAAY
jgi:hypothetical protein